MKTEPHRTGDSLSSTPEEELGAWRTSFWTQYKTLVHRHFLQTVRGAMSAPPLLKARSQKMFSSGCLKLLELSLNLFGREGVEIMEQYVQLKLDVSRLVADSLSLATSHTPDTPTPTHTHARTHTHTHTHTHCGFTTTNVLFQAVLVIFVVSTLFWRLPREEEEVESRRRLVRAMILRVQGSSGSRNLIPRKNHFVFVCFQQSGPENIILVLGIPVVYSDRYAKCRSVTNVVDLSGDGNVDNRQLRSSGQQRSFAL